MRDEIDRYVPINNCNPTITTTTIPSNDRRGEQLTWIPPFLALLHPPTPLSRNGYDRWNDRNGERLHVSGPSQEWRRSSLIPECQQKLRNIRLKYFSMRRLLTCRVPSPLPPTYTPGGCIIDRVPDSVLCCDVTAESENSPQVLSSRSHLL